VTVTLDDLDAAAKRGTPGLDGLLAAVGAQPTPDGWLLADDQVTDLARRICNRATRDATAEALRVVADFLDPDRAALAGAAS
jgi:hypothetical protein